MRIHLLALPNVQTTKAYSLDGFCQATIRFAHILKKLGHFVYLYASEENEAPCDELIKVITKEEQESLLGMGPWEYQTANIEEWSPLFQLSNARTAIEISKRKQPRDIICQIGGYSQHYVSDKHPDLMTVEYSIGYGGSFSKYRVFESHVWRHETYGRQNIGEGRFFDAVIPLFVERSEFIYRKDKEDFYLYCGRLIERKGVAIACRAAEKAGVPLKLIGHGDRSLITYGEYLGAVNSETRNDYLSRARAVFTPTTYIEPFCCVSIEAQMCGTPVICTDWGGFVENVEHGKTGYRCNYLGEFIQAISDVRHLDTAYIRKRAVENYSLEAATPQYKRYFDRLSLLWNSGWDTDFISGESITS